MYSLSMIRSIRGLIPKDYILVDVCKSIHKTLSILFINGDSKIIGVNYSVIRVSILTDYVCIDACAAPKDTLKTLKDFFDFLGFKDTVYIFFCPEMLKATELYKQSKCSNIRLIGRYIKRVNKT